MNTAATNASAARPASSAALTDPFTTWLPDAPTAPGAAPQPSWLATVRAAARELVAADGVPHPKSEGWRYTNLRPLLDLGLRLRAAPPGPFPDPTATPIAVGMLDAALVPGLDAHRLVLIDGRFSADLSDLGALPRGVRLGGLREVLGQDPDALAGLLTQVAGSGAHVFTAINTAAIDDGFVLLLDRGVWLERPVEVIHLSVGGAVPSVAHPRYLIQLGDGAQAELIERYVGVADGVTCTNAVVEVALGRDAVLRHRRVQAEAPTAYHLSGVYLNQGPGSRYHGSNIGLGAGWSRTDLVVRFSGEHAECHLDGLYLAGDRQLIDYHMDVRHSEANCLSRENFKGILYGKGRAVFDGLVYVAKDAQKTDAALSNRNLILSPSAEVDTKPQLEIYADDVKCSHGTTVGQIEPEMLFYLRSRGISAAVARRMLCLGFAGEIIDALGSEALASWVSERVGERLERAPD